MDGKRLARSLEQVTYLFSISGGSVAATFPPLVGPITFHQAGYPVDAVLRLTVHEVNGIRNRYGGDLRARNPLKGPLLSFPGLDMDRWKGKGRACTLAVH